MSRKFGLTALASAMLAVGITSASGVPDLGEYTTRVPEGRLFVSNGRILRCDLFFSVPGKDTVVAPRGSELSQSVPPVVWQYSGLLPVSDYLKTAAIHSVGSDEKIRSWQEVQHTFYEGLRVEGATDLDAKIAYAGAYSFAPRWPLVEFTEVEEKEPVYPDTVLFAIEYIQPSIKGMTLEDYRELALEILKQPEIVSLADIRGVIDSVDATKLSMTERASLGGIGGLGGSDSDVKVISESGNVIATVVEPEGVADSKSGSEDESDAQDGVMVAMPVEASEALMSASGVSVGGKGILVHGDNHRVAKSGDEQLSAVAEKMPEAVMPEVVEMPKVAEMPKVELQKAEVPAEVVETADTLSAVDPAIFAEEILSDQGATDETLSESIASDSMKPKDSHTAAIDGELFIDDSVEAAEVVSVVSAELVDDLNGSADEWIMLPDGTMILRSPDKLASE